MTLQGNRALPKGTRRNGQPISAHGRAAQPIVVRYYPPAHSLWLLTPDPIGAKF